MKKLAVALLATTMLGSPAAFAATTNQQPQQGQKQMQHNQKQGQNQTGQKQTGQNAQNQQNQPNGRQQAQNNQPIPSKDLSRGEIKQVQQALDKDGFKAGRADGRWGHETRAAVKQFQQSKQRQATGQLNQQTVADLGLDASQFSQSQGQQK
jgi:peptidoglycan hydrolase-like protein with peptidoglycan-binding domain